MNAPAGGVNFDGPGHDAEFEQVIADRSEVVKDLARGCRALVYDVLPATVEVVWQHQGTVGWGTGPKKMSEQFCYLQAFREHVGLGFYYGAELPDPTGVLGGSSPNKSAMRSVRISSLHQLDDLALRQLVEAATRHRVPGPRDGT